MRVLLVSEGFHEGGDVDEDARLVGALPSLIRRVVAKIHAVDWAAWKSSDIHVHPGHGSRLFKRILRWVLTAAERGYDGLVLVIDEDGDSSRVREAAKAQDETALSGAFPRAIGIAIRSFDSWILADETALSHVLGLPVPTQSAPEAIADPKTLCKTLLESSSCGLWQREMYVQVAERLRLEMLENRCPNGFGVFAQRLRAW